MQLREIPIGQAFRFVNARDTYIVLNPWTPIEGMQTMNLDRGVQCCFAGEEEIELVTLLSVVLESEDLESLDRLIELEGEDEDRTSRVTRLLEGSEGAIAAELNCP